MGLFVGDLELVALKNSGAITGTGAQTGVDVSAIAGGKAKCFIVVTATAGSGDATIELEESDSSGSGYTDIDGTSTSSINATGIYEIPFETNKQFVRVNTTALTGTSVTCTIHAVGHARYA